MDSQPDFGWAVLITRFSHRITHTVDISEVIGDKYYALVARDKLMGTNKADFVKARLSGLYVTYAVSKSKNKFYPPKAFLSETQVSIPELQRRIYDNPLIIEREFIPLETAICEVPDVTRWVRFVRSGFVGGNDDQRRS
jgi:hypothetical protein